MDGQRTPTQSPRKKRGKLTERVITPKIKGDEAVPEGGKNNNAIPGASGHEKQAKTSSAKTNLEL